MSAIYEFNTLLHYYESKKITREEFQDKLKDFLYLYNVQKHTKEYNYIQNKLRIYNLL